MIRFSLSDSFMNDSVQSQWFVHEWFNRLNDSVQSQWFVHEWFNRLNDSVQSQWFVHEWFNRLNASVQSQRLTWTVGPCGGSEVINDINTVQFLAQTDRFVSLDLNVSSRAAGFHLVSVYCWIHRFNNLCMLFSLSKPWSPLTSIIWPTDCNGSS